MSVWLQPDPGDGTSQSIQQRGKHQASRPTNAVYRHAKPTISNSVHLQNGQVEDSPNVSCDRGGILLGLTQLIPPDTVQIVRFEKALKALHAGCVKEGSVGTCELQCVPLRRIMARRDHKGAGTRPLFCGE